SAPAGARGAASALVAPAGPASCEPPFIAPTRCSTSCRSGSEASRKLQSDRARANARGHGRLGRIGRVREDLQERRLVREIVHVEFQPPGVQRHAHGGVDYIVRRYIDVAVAAVETLRVRAVLVPVVGAYERWQAPADREVIADVQRPGVAWGAAQLVAFADQRRLRHVLEDRSVA